MFDKARVYKMGGDLLDGHLTALRFARHTKKFNRKKGGLRPEDAGS